MKNIISNILLIIISGSIFADTEQRPNDAIERIGKVDLNFYSYRPSYFGVTVDGSDESLNGQGKFQFSVKYELKEDSGLFFGYTQKSFWDLQKKSAPFAETNFSPEIFNIYEVSKINDPDNYLKTVQVGWFRHESTGEDGDGSNGWNTSYIEPTYIIGDFTITPKIWVPFLFASKNTIAPDNPDIFDYLGYGELKLSFGTNKGNLHSLMLRKGKKADHISVMYQWDIGLDNIWNTLGLKNSNVWNPNLFIQYWSGNGESLKNYKNHNNRLLIGFSLIK